MTNIVLVGAYGSGNLGDDVLFDLVLESLKKFSDLSEITVMCNKSAPYLQKIAPGVIQIYKQSNYDLNPKLVVYGGGTQFFSYKKTRSLGALIKFSFFHPDYALRKIMGKMRQEIVADHWAMIGVGFGPFEEGETKISNLLNLLHKCDFIRVRDQWSYEFCQRHSFKNLELGADLAFSSRFLNKLESVDNFSHDYHSGRIAIIIRDWPYAGGSETHIEKTIELAKRLATMNKSIDFILFSNEKKLAKMGLERYGKIVQWEPEKGQLYNFISNLSQYEAVVTSRYHGAIFAYLLDRPVIGIDIDPKIRYFFDQIDRKDSLWGYPYDVEECLQKIENNINLFLKNKPRNEELEQLRFAANKTINDFEEYLNLVL